MDPVRIASALTRAVDRLEFDEPVTHVYNPLSYAKKSHTVYLRRFAQPGPEALLLGMNPGPWGMAQTGVPFGEVAAVKDWLGIEEKVGIPPIEHPKRPVQGFECQRSEVSGRRVWDWAQEHFDSPEAFFERFFIWNYCPLMFLEESGRNRTPDKLPAAEREPLYDACSKALVRLVEELKPKRVIGVGKFAEKRAMQVLSHLDVEFGTILHPSPASPIANRGWAPQVDKQFAQMGIRL
jgi:single-strand selective monofunctional uracil DNA glycosylase